MSSPIDKNRERLKRVYDNYRTARMSREYYACRLSFFQNCNFWYEIVLAIGTSGSAISGWYVWQTATGKTVWAILTGAAALLAILKPALQLPKHIEQYSKLHTGYSSLSYDYGKLVDDIKATGGITREMTKSLNKAEERFKELALQDDPKPSEKLLRDCQGKVKKHVPPFAVWYPEQTQ
ncbi:MAG TPA: hypothetical protein VF666_13715 [Pyrinomonadaceae bacterium]|jgi:hypothetical protein